MTNNFYLITTFVVLCAGFANLELIELNEDNWRSMLKGEWMVEFFAPWCPACKSLSPIWKRFASADLGIKVAQVDVTKSPSLSGRFLVTALPTIYHVKEGEFRQYRGSRDGDAFKFYVNQKEWQKVQPISSWKNPDSIHMSVLSYFFKLSHLLKDFNSSLQEEYGLPTWGSYALLATATIIVGAALGLVLVCIVDFLYPAKKSERQSISLSDERSCVDDEIIDDVAENEDDDEEDENEDNENGDESSEEGSDVKQNSGSESEKENKNEKDEVDSDSNTKLGKKSSPPVRRRKPKAGN